MPPSNDFWSRARTPASILALLSLIAVCVLFFFLGKWQWDRTQDILDAERAASMAAVPIGQIVQPMNPEDYGRTVTATGSYREVDQVRIGSRLSSDSVSGDWIVSALEIESGGSIAVVRGWVPQGQTFATPGEIISIEGILQPSDTFYQGPLDPSGEVLTIDSEQLSAVWNTTLFDGYIVMQSQSPMGVNSPESVPPTISTADVAFPLQNFFYAIQWWVFSLFAVTIYIRWLVVGSKLRT
jgi:cytochrome oxidase assembly protein ShyY1